MCFKTIYKFQEIGFSIDNSYEDENYGRVWGWGRECGGGGEKKREKIERERGVGEW